MALHNLSPGVYKLSPESIKRHTKEGKDRIIIKCRDGRKILTKEQLDAAEKSGKAYYLVIHSDGTRSVEFGKLTEQKVIEKSKEPTVNGDVKTPTFDKAQHASVN